MLSGDLETEIFSAVLNGDRGVDAWSRVSQFFFEHGPSVGALRNVLRAIEEYDDVLASHRREPTETPDGTVVVAGSGKENFKTLNISTAAAVVAAAAGCTVVKGVSRSVSATTGSRDILDELALPVVTSPAAFARALGRDPIVFVDYSTFCPRFFATYDGRFTSLQVTGMFMPVLALPVRARGFVYGLSVPQTEVAAQFIYESGLWSGPGIVVNTQLTPGESIDEYSRYGLRRVSTADAGGVVTVEVAGDEPSEEWRRDVAHLGAHALNARAMVAALSGSGSADATELVVDNAASVIACAGGLSWAEAAEAASRAVSSGAAGRLLQRMAR